MSKLETITSSINYSQIPSSQGDIPLNKKEDGKKETPEEIHKWLSETESFKQPEQRNYISQNKPLYPEMEKTILESVNQLRTAIKDLKANRLTPVSLYEIVEIVESYRIDPKELTEAYELLGIKY